MAVVTKHDAGMVAWADLGTSDPAAAVKFYGALFGWTCVEQMPAGQGTYRMCKLGDHDAAAITQLSGDEKAQGVPPHWNTYVAVADADKATGRVAAAGGKVLMPAFDVMDAGRMSVVQDPCGAVLCLWQAKKHVGAQVTGEPGTLCWSELMTADTSACAKFYGALFGWKGEPMAMPGPHPYTIFKVGEKSAAGMMPLGADMKGVPPHWMVYFMVADCDAIAKKVAELGGKVYVPPQSVPKVGRFAVLADGQGASFGVLQPER